MTLIEYFNAFQTFSAAKRLSPNVRALYYAVLSEFNKRRYPESLKLTNEYLMNISGINTRSAFETARTTLINHQTIYHKRGNYRLGNVTVNDTGFKYELPPRDNVITMKIPTPAKTTIPQTPEPMFKDNGWVSAKVQETWFKYEGEQMESSVMQGLYPLEQTFGTSEVCKAILAARQANTQERLSLPYVRTFLERQQKGGTKNARAGSRPVAEDWENQPPDWLG